jgi:hypothetical protein
MKITFPPNSHNTPGLEASAISQLCDVRFLTGEAEVQIRFTQDKYDILSGGELINITFPDDNLSIFNELANPDLPPSTDIFYDEVAAVLEKSSHKWMELVDWVSVTFGFLLDDIATVRFTFPNRRLLRIRSQSTFTR